MGLFLFYSTTIIADKTIFAQTDNKMSLITSILEKDTFELEDIVALLGSENNDKKALFTEAARVKEQHVGNTVYLRGLIEFSNVCRKNCLYCGIRMDNKTVERYTLTDKEVLEAAKFALDNRYGSIVIQGGEITSPDFTRRIENLLHAKDSQSFV